MSKIKWVNLIPYPNHRDYAQGNHWVYLLHSRATDLYKIGATDDIRLRMRTVVRDNANDVPGPYRLVHSIWTNSGFYLERQLHLLFRHRHSVREWYRLTKADVRWICALGDTLPDGIPLRTDVIPPLAEWSD